MAFSTSAADSRPGVMAAPEKAARRNVRRFKSGEVGGGMAAEIMAHSLGRSQGRNALE
jgi:TRAP-type uncharacterized transport system substrate-binding protein